MWCNGLLCAPVLAVATFSTGELRDSLAFPVRRPRNANACAPPAQRLRAAHATPVLPSVQFL